MQKFLFLGSGVVIAGLVVQAHMSWVSDFKVSAGLEQAKAETLRVQESDMAIAESRIDNRCYNISINNTTPVQITEGMAIYGHSAIDNRTSIADGTVVCDDFGGTAVMKGGAATQFASSPYYKGYEP